jgi:DUF3040 family protein
VPLSEHEQRLLEQMERALYAEDPKFASSLRGRDPRSNFRRRIALAVLGFILGVVALMAGLVTKLVPVSVLGFVVMLAAALFAVTSYRQLTSAGKLGVVDNTTGAVRRPQQAQPAPRKARDHRGLMEKFEERWNKRRDENGR